MKKNDFVANVVYKAAIAEEMQWREEQKNRCDVAILERLLEEVRKLGYSYRHLADITNRENTDKELLHILLKYIDCFQDEGITAELVGVVGQKGNTWATETIIKSYHKLSAKAKWQQAGFYDNALNRIKDRRFIAEYIDLLKNPEDAIKLPLTMIMLGKWKCEEAKPHFFDYLEADILYLNDQISDLVFISLEALSYFEDPKGVILNTIEKKVTTRNKDLQTAAKKAMKRLRKGDKGGQGDGSPVS